MKTFKVTIETLDHQVFQYEVNSNSSSTKLCDKIFNQTPNVRGVDVRPAN
jgi:hypothetical protein